MSLFKRAQRMRERDDAESSDVVYARMVASGRARGESEACSTGSCARCVECACPCHG